MKKLGLDDRYSREGKVRFICMHPRYRNKNIYITPIFDIAINDYRYVPEDCDNPEAEKIVKKYIKDETMQVFVRHNQVFDKSKDNDYAYLMLMMVQSPRIVKSESEIVPGTTIGYIYDSEYEASVKVAKTNVKYELIDKVHNLSLENQERLAYYLGLDAKKMSVSVMMSTIYEKLENEPESVRAFFTDTDAEIKTIINMMKSEGLVKKRNGAFYFQDIYLGVGLSEVVNFLKQDANSDIYSSMRKVLRNPLANIEGRVDRTGPEMETPSVHEEVAEKGNTDKRMVGRGRQVRKEG